MKILPFVHRGEVFMRNDDTVELVAMQAFVTAEGQTVLRIGKNTFWFDANGVYDGQEMSVDTGKSPHGVEHLEQLIAEAHQNREHAPTSPYFDPGTNGWKKEIAGWPVDERPKKAEPIEGDLTFSSKPVEGIILKKKS